MGKYLKNFNTTEEYEAFREGDQYLVPNVSFIENTASVINDSWYVPESGDDSSTTSNEKVLKYYKINSMYNGINYYEQWKELLKPFVETVRNITNYDVRIFSCLYYGSYMSNYGNSFTCITTGDGENLSSLYFSDRWNCYNEEMVNVTRLSNYLEDKSIEGIPNLLDCVTEISETEFFSMGRGIEF